MSHDYMLQIYNIGTPMYKGITTDDIMDFYKLLNKDDSNFHRWYETLTGDPIFGKTVGIRLKEAVESKGIDKTKDFLGDYYDEDITSLINLITGKEVTVDVPIDIPLGAPVGIVGAQGGSSKIISSKMISPQTGGAYTPTEAAGNLLSIIAYIFHRDMDKVKEFNMDDIPTAKTDILEGTKDKNMSVFAKEQRKAAAELAKIKGKALPSPWGGVGGNGFITTELSGTLKMRARLIYVVSVNNKEYVTKITQPTDLYKTEIDIYRELDQISELENNLIHIHGGGWLNVTSTKKLTAIDFAFPYQNKVNMIHSLRNIVLKFANGSEFLRIPAGYGITPRYGYSGYIMIYKKYRDICMLTNTGRVFYSILDFNPGYVTLNNYVNTKNPPGERKCILAFNVLRMLAHINRRYGFIHWDLHGENLLINQFDNFKFFDFDLSSTKNITNTVLFERLQQMDLYNTLMWQGKLQEYGFLYDAFRFFNALSINQNCSNYPNISIISRNMYTTYTTAIKAAIKAFRLKFPAIKHIPQVIYFNTMVMIIETYVKGGTMYNRLLAAINLSPIKQTLRTPPQLFRPSPPIKQTLRTPPLLFGPSTTPFTVSTPQLLGQPSTFQLDTPFTVSTSQLFGSPSTFQLDTPQLLGPPSTFDQGSVLYEGSQSYDKYYKKKYLKYKKKYLLLCRITKHKYK